MNYPLISEYIEAIKLAEDNFATLTNLRPIMDEEGNPIMTSGNFAVVFKMKDTANGNLYAVKCFLKDQPNRAESYKMIADELEYVSSTFLVQFRYLDKELFVDTNNSEECEFPVLIMDWVEGVTLDKYIRQNIDDQYVLQMLAYQFSKLAMWIIPQPFAHGDIKPDNVMVREDGSLVLIDYDGMYVPAMKGQKARELGSPDFRHPSRTENDFDEYIDDFPLISILLSLRLIAEDSSLLEKYGAVDRLLFSEKDYRQISLCQLLKERFPSSDNEINTLVSLFTLALTQGSLSKVSIRLLTLNRSEEPEILSTEITDEDLAIAWEDKYGVKYSKDKTKLIKFSPWNEVISYKVIPCCKELGPECFSIDWDVDEDSAELIGNNLINLILPEGIESIGDSAFIGCDNLSNLVIPKSVEEIGKLSIGRNQKCFVWIEGKPYIKEISENVILVVSKDNYEFYKKAHPQNRVVLDPRMCPLYETICIDKVFYDINKDWVIGCSDDIPSLVTIDQSVIGIAPYAFHNRKDINEIFLPDSLLYIGEYAFYSSSLHRINIPDSVIFIGGSAFEYNKELETVHLPKELREIHNVCFSNCYKMKEIGLPYNLRRIGNGAFSGCGLKELQLPYRVKIIDNGAFRWCHDLILIDFASSRPKVCNNAFVDCESLEVILLPFNDCIIERGAFGQLPNIRLIYNFDSYDYNIPTNIKNKIVPLKVQSCIIKDQLGNLVRKIREKADLRTEVFPADLKKNSYVDEYGVYYSFDKKRLLYASKPLDSYVIPEGTEVICSYAFKENSISKVAFPESLRIIGDGAFTSCIQLKSIIFPDHIQNLGNSTFSSCFSLTKIKLNHKIEILPSGTFSSCDSLKNVDLRETSIKAIEAHSFSWCSNLETVSLPSSLHIINHHAFAYCEKMEAIIIPENVNKIEEEIFKDCANLKTINFYGCPTKIGSSLFWGCDNLKNIYIPKGTIEYFAKQLYYYKGKIIESNENEIN